MLSGEDLEATAVTLGRTQDFCGRLDFFSADHTYCKTSSPSTRHWLDVIELSCREYRLTPVPPVLAVGCDVCRPWRPNGNVRTTRPSAHDIMAVRKLSIKAFT